jgi:hypothetical protein
MDRDSDEPGGSRRRFRSLDATVLIALASVLVALVYNGLQVRNSAEQLDQGQRNLERSTRADEFATLTEMHDRVVRTNDQSLKSSYAFVKECADDPRVAGVECEGDADRFVPASLEVALAITPYEGVVYALEREVVPAEAAKVWTVYLVCDYRAAAEVVRIAADAIGSGGPGLAGYTPRLAGFVEKHHVDQELCPLTLG